MYLRKYFDDYADLLRSWHLRKNMETILEIL